MAPSVATVTVRTFALLAGVTAQCPPVGISAKAKSCYMGQMGPASMGFPPVVIETLHGGFCTSLSMSCDDYMAKYNNPVPSAECPTGQQVTILGLTTDYACPGSFEGLNVSVCYTTNCNSGPVPSSPISATDCPPQGVTSSDASYKMSCYMGMVGPASMGFPPVTTEPVHDGFCTSLTLSCAAFVAKYNMTTAECPAGQEVTFLGLTTDYACPGAFQGVNVSVCFTTNCNIPPLI